MMQIVAIEEGGIACDASCPYYEESGVVRGYGGPMKTHCRQVMEPIIVDCNLYNPKLIQFAKGVKPEQWKQVLKALGLKAKKVRKAYKKDHKEIHPVGWSPKLRVKSL